MYDSQFTQQYSQWVLGWATGWLRGAMRQQCTLLRVTLGMHRTPLLKLQVQNLKLRADAPFSQQKREAAQVLLLKR